MTLNSTIAAKILTFLHLFAHFFVYTFDRNKPPKYNLRIDKITLNIRDNLILLLV